MLAFGKHIPYLPDCILLVLACLLHFVQWRSLRCLPSLRASRLRRYAISAAFLASALYIVLAIYTSTHGIARHLPGGDWVYWLRGIGYLWALITTGAFLLMPMLRAAEGRFCASRRQFFRAAQGAALACPAILTGYGVLGERTRFRIKEVDLPVKGLAPDLDGLRILQLSDIHMSPFLREPDLERVIDMANDTRPHLAVVTGDLITGIHDPLELCMKQLSRLKADAGVLGCNGNHEIFARAEDRVQTLGRRLGMNFLRGEAVLLRFGKARINVVGVDYQPMRSVYLSGMEKLVRPDALNLLLSHNPDVFPAAAAKGYQVTLAGHTHGGQVTVEILHQWANVARFFTPYVYGRYHREGAVLYVTRGIGTVGVPARIGAPPEIPVIRLCAA